MNDLILRKIKKIKIFIMDVDGTLTDGTIIMDSNGIESKHFNVKDGMGITLAHKAGMLTGIISARKSEIVSRRAQELNITYVKQGVSDKLAALYEILNETGFEKEEAAFIGDDINDISCCNEVGLSLAVSDAADELKEIVNYILSKEGGKGAVREAVELILKNKEL
ncbi:3-deoxy-D-manno-octulosonate 8-phosphate phosphatase [Paenibacillus sp. H1-7]|uniref:KdsC family phosphatase n=1 Tax=Paenibacillus sp. H1-7 TaxID=2282849 RepID=UPI001EF8976E|nr:HAD-IIIA family hydrolase [Paenibacillus sp. H1-7]ULL19037.1 3-deoxy-D-manno-octulosonate 8-phosphate phosphatase [Paenibacillus sp. H1-7]